MYRHSLFVTAVRLRCCQSSDLIRLCHQRKRSNRNARYHRSLDTRILRESAKLERDRSLLLSIEKEF